MQVKRSDPQNDYHHGQNYYEQYFSKRIVLAQLICKLYKTIKFLRMFSCKQGQTGGSNITKKMVWWINFCNSYKDDCKNNCSNRPVPTFQERTLREKEGKAAN